MVREAGTLQALEDILSRLLTGGHARPNFLQTARAGDGEDFVGERLSQAAAAKSR